MTPEEARRVVQAALERVAPELDPTMLSDDDELRADLDLDSMDFLNVMIAISEQTGLEIPERDYAEVATYGGLLGYLAGR